MPTKKNRIQTILSNEEKTILEEQAKKEKLSLSAYLRKIMLEEANKSKKK